jgi:hypothetical protein
MTSSDRDVPVRTRLVFYFVLTGTKPVDALSSAGKSPMLRARASGGAADAGALALPKGVGISHTQAARPGAAA